MTLPALPLPRRVRRRFRPWIRLCPTRRALSRRTTLQRAGVFTTSTYDPASQLTTLEHRRTSDQTRLQQREGSAMTPQEVVAHELIGHAWAHNRSGGLQGHEEFAKAVRRHVARELQTSSVFRRVLNGVLQEGK